MANRTTKQKRNNLITGNTGMYFVAYQLSRRGWNVMPTSRNARGIDLLAYDGSARKFLGLQIKTLSRGRNAVPSACVRIFSAIGGSSLPTSATLPKMKTRNVSY